MPAGYQRTIAQSLANVSLSKVKKAFSDNYVNEQDLCKIYSKAVEIAERRVSSNVREKRRLQRILSKHIQAV